MRVFIFLCIYIYIFALEYGNRKLTVNDHSQANTNETTKKKNTHKHIIFNVNKYTAHCMLSLLFWIADMPDITEFQWTFQFFPSIYLYPHPFLWFLYQNFSKANNVKHEHWEQIIFNWDFNHSRCTLIWVKYAFCLLIWKEKQVHNEVFT